MQGVKSQILPKYHGHISFFKYRDGPPGPVPGKRRRPVRVAVPKNAQRLRGFSDPFYCAQIQELCIVSTASRNCCCETSAWVPVPSCVPGQFYRKFEVITYMSCCPSQCIA
jgi:hypothetical protein